MSFGNHVTTTILNQFDRNRQDHRAEAKRVDLFLSLHPVNSNHQIHPEQKGNINLNYNSYLVEMEIPAGGNALDHRLVPDAVKLGFFYGQQWKSPEGIAMAGKLPKKGNPFPVPSTMAK